MYNVWAAIISVGGMVLVTFFNLLGTRWSTRQENERLRDHLLEDWRLQQFGEWEKELRDCLSRLLAAVDPQLPSDFDYANIIAIVHRTQLLLDANDSDQSDLNSAVNKLALTITGWGEGQFNRRQMLPLQDAVMLASKSNSGGHFNTAQNRAGGDSSMVGCLVGLLKYSCK